MHVKEKVLDGYSCPSMAVLHQEDGELNACSWMPQQSLSGADGPGHSWTVLFFTPKKLTLLPAKGSSSETQAHKPRRPSGQNRKKASFSHVFNQPHPPTQKVPPTLWQAFPHQLKQWTLPTDLPTGNPSSLRLFFNVVLGFIKLLIKTNQHTHNSIPSLFWAWQSSRPNSMDRGQKLQSSRFQAFIQDNASETLWVWPNHLRIYIPMSPQVIPIMFQYGNCKCQRFLSHLLPLNKICNFAPIIKSSIGTLMDVFITLCSRQSYFPHC